MRTTKPAALQKKWQELIRQQQQSKLSVSAFCRQHGFSDQSFYNWRKRLAADEPVRFALVDANPSGTDGLAPLELILRHHQRSRSTLSTARKVAASAPGEMRRRSPDQMSAKSVQLHRMPTTYRCIGRRRSSGASAWI